MPAQVAPPIRLKQQYRDLTVPALMKQLGFKNALQVPKLVKIVINIGMGEAVDNIKLLDAAVQNLSTDSAVGR